MMGRDERRKFLRQYYPLRVRLKVNLTVVYELLKRCGLKGTLKLMIEMFKVNREDKVLKMLKDASSKQEFLSMYQSLPAIVLYRALSRLWPQQSRRILENVVTKATLVFLGWAVGDMSRESISSMDDEMLEGYARGISEKFFNADIKWEEISRDRMSFYVTRCLFPEICRQSGVDEIATVFCKGDELFFGSVLRNVKLTREQLISMGDERCHFVFQWKDNHESGPR